MIFGIRIGETSCVSYAPNILITERFRSLYVFEGVSVDGDADIDGWTE